MDEFTVPLAEFKNDIEIAIEHTEKEPVFITKEGGPVAVLLSSEEYALLKLRERRLSDYLHTMTPEDVEALENAEYGVVYDPGIKKAPEDT